VLLGNWYFDRSGPKVHVVEPGRGANRRHNE
jgi:hypothetical protein